MSIASPTLRSSSSTVPGPRLSSSPTSMWARPSTAETCTGTSNTASRSPAPREVGSGADAARTGSGTASSPVRLGNGTLSSAILLLPGTQRPPALPRRDVASDRLGNGGLGGGAIALEAALRPFDATVARRDVALRHHHQPALEAARAGDLLEPLLGVGVEIGVDPHDDVRRRDHLAETVVGERGDLGERLLGDQVGGELAADRERHLDGFRLERVLDPLEARAQLL